MRVSYGLLRKLLLLGYLAGFLGGGLWLFRRVTVTPEGPRPFTLDAALDLLVHDYRFVAQEILIFAAAFAPLALASMVRYRWERRVMINTVKFLDSLEANLRAGLPYFNALEKTAESGFEPVGGAVLKGLRRFGLGVQFEEAMRELTREIDHAYGHFLYNILVSISNAGYRMASATERIGRIFHELENFRFEKDAQLKGYTFIVALTILSGMVVILLIFTKFLDAIYASEAVGELVTPVDYSLVKTLGLYALAMTALFGGLTMSKIVRGSVIYGAPMIVGFLALFATVFLLFV